MSADDTQAQRLTDAEREAICACPAGWQWGHSPSCEDRATAVERILAARSVRDDPTFRERIPDAVELLAERRDEWHEADGDWWDGYQAALADLRAVLAEHAPADDYQECMACGSPEHRMEDCPSAPNATPADDPTRQAAAHIEAATGSMRSAVDVGPGCYSPEGWHALCVRLLDRLAATPEDGAR